ncbi:MAG: glycosyltransferase family 39 protein [Actinomycetota bacterium]
MAEPADVAAPKRTTSQTVRVLPTWILLSSIIAVAGGVRLVGLTEQPLWFDEAWTHIYVTSPLAKILSLTDPIDIGNPPLYYAIVHLWTLVAGASDLALRLPSVFFGVLTIPVVYALGREIAGRPLGLTLALFTAISPMSIEHSQQARGYAFLALAASVAMWGLAHLLANRADAGRPIGTGLLRATPLRDQRRARTTVLAWTAVATGTAAAVLTHHTAVFLVLAMNTTVAGLWLFEHRPRERFYANWLLAQALMLLLIAPWLSNFIQQSRTVYADFWIVSPTVSDVVIAGKHLVSGWSPAVFGAVSVLLAAILGAVAFWSWRRMPRWILFVVLLIAVPLIGELAATPFRPIFRRQTLIWCAIPVSLAMARGALSLRDRWIAPAIASVVVLSATGIANHQLNYSNAAWNEVAATILAERQPGDGVIVAERITEPIVERYLGADAVRASPIPVETVLDSAAMPEAVAGHERIWLLCWPGCEPNGQPAFDWLTERSILVEQRSARGAELYLFVPG